LIIAIFFNDILFFFFGIVLGGNNTTIDPELSATTLSRVSKREE
jgi:hypothetical protein